MPPGLISSAAPGKKAAPKAAPRRRPAPAAAQASSTQATPASTTVETGEGVAPPSPPPTQAPPQEDAIAQYEPTRSLPESEAPSRSLAKQSLSEPASEPEAERRPRTSQPESVEQLLPVTVVQPAAPVAPVVPNVHSTPDPTPPRVDPNEQRENREREEVGSQSEADSQHRKEQQGPQLHEKVADEPSSRVAVEELERDQSRREEVVASSVDTVQPTAGRKTRSKRVRVEAPAETAARPPKRRKRTSARSNATVQANVQSEGASQVEAESTQAEAQAGPDQEPVAPKRASKRKATTRKPPPNKPNGKKKAKSAANTDTLDDEDKSENVEHTSVDHAESEEQARAAPKKSRRKPRKKPQTQSAEGEAPQEQGDGGQQEADGGQPAEDESDAEAHEIDPKTLSMWDLSHDYRHGKQSERGRQMAAIDWDEVAAKRRAEVEAIAAGVAGEQQQQATAGETVVQSTEGPDGTNNDSAQAQVNGASQTGDAPAAADTGNIEFATDEDGNIILPDSNLEITRGAEAHAAAVNGEPIEEVNDLTMQINRTTWMNNNRRDPVDRVPAWKWKSDPWSEEETDRFYEALQMFGTDFFVISKMFPPKTRRMIKAKFTREEKLDPKRVDDALSGKSTKPMSLEHYSQATGRDMSVFTKYDGVEHAERMINESLRDRQEQMTSQVQQEAALAEEKAAKEKEEKKMRQKVRIQARKTKKGRGGGGGTMGGGPDEVTADD